MFTLAMCVVCLIQYLLFAFAFLFVGLAVTITNITVMMAQVVFTVTIIQVVFYTNVLCVSSTQHSNS